MKNKILSIGVVAFLAFSTFQSCREDITDLSPYGQVPASDAFSSPTLVDNAVNGVYNAAQMGRFNGTEDSPVPRGYVFGAAYFQQNEARGEDVVNTQAFYQLTYESNYDPTTANNVYYWEEAYTLINKANIVLNGLDYAVQNNVITEAKANIYRAEVRFFRALAHMELLKHFARPYHLDAGASLGVPYRTKATQVPGDVDTNIQQGRNTVKECYDLAFADLDFAETYAQTKAQKSGQEKIVRVTQGAAIALKMDMKLRMRDWQGVITEFAKLDGQYTLTEGPSDVFANNYSNSESVFSILNTANTNPGVNGALASQFNRRSLLAISPILWNDPMWLADDKRRSETAEVALSATRKGVFTRKYKDVTDYKDASPIFRYADMVLMAAEANARLGNTATALVLLNSVRDRALADAATQTYTAASFATSSDLVKAILKERRIELNSEGKRWGDIHRLINDDVDPTVGIPAKVPNGFPLNGWYSVGTAYSGQTTQAIPYTDTRFLWPIPLQELNNNPVLRTQQNPGW